MVRFIWCLAVLYVIINCYRRHKTVCVENYRIIQLLESREYVAEKVFDERAM